MDTERLKEQFELRLMEHIREHSKVLYYPRRFADMVERDGAFMAVDHVFNEDMAEGVPRHAAFERAREAGRLDLTVEWLVWAEPRWQPLFSAPQLRYLKQLAEDLEFPKRTDISHASDEPMSQ
jgi:hypothetical protein